MSRPAYYSAMERGKRYQFFRCLRICSLGLLSITSKICQITKILHAVDQAGMYAWKHGHRITTHPGPFNVLGSPNPETVRKTIKELDTLKCLTWGSTVLTPRSTHVGIRWYPSDTADRWCRNFLSCPLTAKTVSWRTTIRHQCGLLATCMTTFTKQFIFLLCLTITIIASALAVRLRASVATCSVYLAWCHTSCALV